jgi:cytochrome c-type biogenesis protein CcmH
MKALLLLLSLSAQSVLAGSAAPESPYAQPLPAAQEARVHQLAKELRCPVCQGVSIADSPATVAQAQLIKVREMIATGKSDDEVREYFVSRYGEWALLRPKAEGVNLLVWLGPALLLLGGLAIIGRQVIRGPGAAQPSPPPPAASENAEEDEYLRAVRREVEK